MYNIWKQYEIKVLMVPILETDIVNISTVMLSN